MLRITNYDLELKSKNMSDLKIALFSDIHFYGKEKMLSNIVSELKKTKPDYVCIPGDLFDYNAAEKDLDTLVKFIGNLASFSKVIISLGNHDVKKKIDNHDVYNYPKDFIDKVNTIDNAYLLDNESININGICFYGLTIPFDTYYGEGLKSFVDNLKIKLDGKLNILLCHNPMLFLDNKVMHKIKNVDIILSGHMHNGVIPIGLDRIIKTDRGIISPKKKLFPKYARGMVKVNNGKTVLIVSKGIRTFHSFLPAFIRVFNFLYPSNIEYINI